MSAARARFLTALVVCAALPAGAHADEFFSIGNENALLRGFYLPRAADMRAADAASLSANLAIANTTSVEADAREYLFVDGESTTLRLSFDAPLAADWRYRLSIPIIHDGGGFLDSAIESWHRFFGLPRGDRANYPKNRLRYFYVADGRAEVDVRESQTGVGDLAGELGWFAADDAVKTVSVWAGLEAPTGSARRSMGDGAWDGSVWLHAALRQSRWQWGGELGVAEPFGDEIFGGDGRRACAFARAAVTWDATRSVALRLQFDAQSARLKHTELRFLGPSLSGTLGASLRMNQHWRLELGFSEDAAVNTAPDVTFFLGLRRYWPR